MDKFDEFLEKLGSGIELRPYQKEILRNAMKDEKICLTYPPHNGRLYFQNLLYFMQVLLSEGEKKMTCREKLAIEHPSRVNSNCCGGCVGCPSYYGYAGMPDFGCSEKGACTRCWDRPVENMPVNMVELGRVLRRGVELGVHFGFDFGNLRPKIRKVVFNDPATIILWDDETKTVVKAENEPFDPEKGMAMAIAKKFLGNNHAYYNQFKRWLPKKK